MGPAHKPIANNADVELFHRKYRRKRRPDCGRSGKPNLSPKAALVTERRAPNVRTFHLILRSPGARHSRIHVNSRPALHCEPNYYYGSMNARLPRGGVPATSQRTALRQVLYQNWKCGKTLGIRRFRLRKQRSGEKNFFVDGS